MENYSTASSEPVTTHEIGQALGLRHTDLFSRQICKQSGKSAGSDGAVHIPGTQIGYDSKPGMLTCLSTK